MNAHVAIRPAASIRADYDARQAQLVAMRAAYKAREAELDTAIKAEFPGRDEWDWQRACAAVAGDNCRRNDDTSQDEALAASPAILAAWEAYMRDLHAFYAFRDGPGGVLGGRGL